MKGGEGTDEQEVVPDLLQPFKILSELCVQCRCSQLAVFPILVVTLSIQEPVRDLVVSWCTHNGHDILQFCC